MLNVPSAFTYQPSYAGVMLAPRSRCGSSGSGFCGVWATVAMAHIATRPRQTGSDGLIMVRRAYILPDHRRSTAARSTPVPWSFLAAGSAADAGVAPHLQVDHRRHRP